MYEALASFAQTWGLLLFIALFAAVVAYALWPKNQAKFDRAARMPLDDDKPAAAEDEAPDARPEDRKDG